MKPSDSIVSGKTMSAHFTMCAAAGATSLRVAFAFTNGNASCELLFH